MTDLAILQDGLREDDDSTDGTLVSYFSRFLDRISTEDINRNCSLESTVQLRSKLHYRNVPAK